jgi:drug/metabolite transporter (DMT)-like permease
MFSATAATSGIYAIAKLPLALATSLGFTRPLFMIIIAALFLGEVVGWRRGVATVIGFVGVVTTIGPSHVDLSWGFLAALGSAASLAAAMAVVKSLSRIDNPATIMCWSTTGVAVVVAIPAFIAWTDPTPMEWFLMGSTGVTASMGQYMMIRAFTHGEATVVNPIDYSQIVLTSIAGYFLFSEVPTIWTGVGTLIIVAATLYIVLRDAKLKAAPAKPE